MEEVAERLVRIAHDNRFRVVRISGNEPTLCEMSACCDKRG